jgi:outer membrane protein assembly factor BamE (lipoprotein component of BamABCDE complex)
MENLSETCITAGRPNQFKTVKTMFIKTKLAILGLCLAIFAGCATPEGQRSTDNRPINERISVGMTKGEVHAAIGDPSGKSMNSDGDEIWNYNDNAKMWIPFYAISGGKFENLTIHFDTDGKVKSWESGKHGIF